jgi:hypothetical protein
LLYFHSLPRKYPRGPLTPSPTINQIHLPGHPHLKIFLLIFHRWFIVDLLISIRLAGLVVGMETKVFHGRRIQSRIEYTAKVSIKHATTEEKARLLSVLFDTNQLAIVRSACSASNARKSSQRSVPEKWQCIMAKSGH